jgi:predicted nucleic acid-binding protein
MDGFTGPILTTNWVLTELGNYLSKGQDRVLFAPFVRDLRSDARVRIVSVDERLFDLGMSLYESRRDKQWSMTDCISFALMEENALREAFTADHHFEQAGFVALLKSS